MYINCKGVCFPLMLAVGFFLTFAIAPTNIGLLTIFASIAGIVLARSPILLMLSFLNFSLGVAFDFFIRVQHYFYFYFQKGVTVEYLCLVSGLLYASFFYFDHYSSPVGLKYVSYSLRFPRVSRMLFWPAALLVAGASAFILQSESNLLKGDFDAYELQKYPFLEYISLVLAMIFLSAQRRGKRSVLIGYGVGAAFVLTCLVTSYRMVAILCTLSMMFVVFNNKKVNKIPVVSMWLLSYVGLTYISYLRLGMLDIDIENILGYVDGRLDNTFTGVIETALIYTEISSKQLLSENLLHFLGTIAPVPNTVIPDSMLYIVEAGRNYFMPGGGALAGFVIYFNYLLLIPYFLYVNYALRCGGKSPLAAAMYLILFATITRWWLYGPFVLFKFLGVFLFLQFVNRLLINFERMTPRMGRRKVSF